MPRTCTVRQHPESFAINEALVIEGVPNRRVAAQYDLSENAIRRHKAHIPELLLQARDLTQEFEAQQILEKILRLEEETLTQLRAGKVDVDNNDGDRRVVLQAIREQRANIERGCNQSVSYP